MNNPRLPEAKIAADVAALRTPKEKREEKFFRGLSRTRESKEIQPP
jgi:hypothetical protein